MEQDQPEVRDGVAIIGMAGRFPGSGDVEAFWRNLINGVGTISRFGEDELEFSVAPEAGKRGRDKYVRARGILENVDRFDAEFFGVTPGEAELMDPQHRLFLECAWESLESSGYDPGAYGGLIGVYAGCSVNTYLLYNLCRDRDYAARHAANFQVGSYSAMLGNDAHFLATRASYKLDLRGPSMSVQTACSSSLVAVCQACVSLRTYQCDMALAGGVSITFPQKRDYLYEEGSLVSSDGACRAFDAAADGTVFGHGAGVVLLKRLEDAVTEGDTILAVIKGSAVNNDGAGKVSYAAPSIEAQAGVVALAQAAAGVDPESISYIEAHGTGTPLGDPIEVAALTKAFRDGGAKRSGYCPIGTAKTHISHLDAAAGVTGLMKTVLQLQHEKIPALLNFRSPNPKIDFTHSPFFPADRNLEWKRGALPRRAGVSAFGVGGTNAHVVVEEAPGAEPIAASRRQQLLVLSARTESALRQMSGNLAAYLESRPEQSLADAAFTLAKGRKSFAFRRAVVAGDMAEAVSRLRGDDAKSLPVGRAAQSQPSVIFLFPGQGAPYVEAGRELYETEAVFRAEVDRCAEISRGNLGSDLRAVLYPESAAPEEAKSANRRTPVAQAAVFALDYALARLWISWGIKPIAMIGHDIGEYAAAVLAETLTLEEALAALSARASLASDQPRESLLAVRESAREVESFAPAAASVASLDVSRLCLVSGPPEVLAGFRAQLKAKGVSSRFLPASRGFPFTRTGSRQAGSAESAHRTARRPLRIPWISARTGAWITAEDLANPRYWDRPVRNGARFVDAVEKMATDAGVTLLEVGPGRSLTRLVNQRRGRLATQIEPTFDQEYACGGELASMLATLGRLWTAGVKPDWDAYFAGERRRRIPLPTYPFERRRHWVEPPRREVLATGGVPCENELIEKTIHEQLRLMAEQLDVLLGEPVSPAESFSG